jgi:hypothetical protein
MKLGDVVLYRMDAANTERLNRIRAPWGLGESAPDNWPRGAQAHVGSAVVAGRQYPAMVTAIANGRAGLQVLLEGSDSLWVPSAKEGSGEGEYAVR